MCDFDCHLLLKVTIDWVCCLMTLVRMMQALRTRDAAKKFVLEAARFPDIRVYYVDIYTITFKHRRILYEIYFEIQ